MWLEGTLARRKKRHWSTGRDERWAGDNKLDRTAAVYVVGGGPGLDAGTET